MKVHLVLTTALCFLCTGLTLGLTPAASAQDQSSHVQPPPKYIYLENEAIKPGMEDAVIKNEGSQAQALRDANASLHYFGMVAITGAPRAIFIAGYNSFDQMQKDHEQMMANTKLSDALKADSTSESSMLAGTHGSIYEYREDLSLNPAVDIAQMRFFDMTLLRVRQGHYQDLERLAKLYVKAYSSIPGANFAVFEKEYGEGSGNTFIIVTPLKSLAGVDQEMLDGKNLPKAAGADQLQVMREIGGTTVESSESDLFAVVPQMSYVPAAWASEAPGFWNKKD